MHREVYDWLRQTRHQYPALFNGGRVLECGAHIETYSPRALFPASDYTGLDARPGPGVDVVSLVHKYAPGTCFDVVVCTQMLEHDPHWRESLGNMVDVLKPGGSLLLTFAGPGYPEHDMKDSPWPGYYENRSTGDALDILGDRFQLTEIEERGQDVYIQAIDKLGGAAL